MIEDKIIVVPHGPEKITVKEAMEELDLSFKEIQGELEDRGIEMTNVRKKIPVEIVRGIERGRCLPVEDEEETPWQTRVFVDSFGKENVNVSLSKCGKFFSYIIKHGNQESKFQMIANALQLKNGALTRDAEDVNKMVHMTKMKFKMLYQPPNPIKGIAESLGIRKKEN